MKRIMSILLAILMAAAACAAAEQPAADVYAIGSYEQDNDAGNGPEPLYWRPIYTEGDLVLMLCENVIEDRPYAADGASGWADSDLRAWLNDDFMNAAFTPQERAGIVLVSVKNGQDAEGNACKAEKTEDYIFCLSLEETGLLLGDDALRTGAPSEYAKNLAGGSARYGYWWLRSSGVESQNAAAVQYAGVVGVSPVNYLCGVRPAMYVKASALSGDVIDSLPAGEPGGSDPVDVGSPATGADGAAMPGISAPISAPAEPVQPQEGGAVLSPVRDMGNGCYAVDLGEDGSVETLHLYAAYQQDGLGETQVYRMDVSNEQGENLTQLLLIPSIGDGEDVSLRVARLDERRLYIEIMTHLEGTSIEYIVFIWNGSGLEKEAHLRDPGYSDGEEIYDEHHDEVLYSLIDGEQGGIYASRQEALNGEFEIFGLRFEPQEYTHWSDSYVTEHLLARLDASAVVCEVYLQATHHGEAVVGFAGDMRYVSATGDAYVRSGPGRDYDSMGVMQAGETAPYREEEIVDERGVAWYKILFDGKDGWISAEYARVDG